MANLKIESEDNYGLEFIIFFKLSGVLFDWNMGEFSIVKNINLYRTKYHDFGPTFATEKLASLDKIKIVNTWNANHICRHSQNAISAFILFLFIVLNIFNIFFSRNIKDKTIRSKSLLIDLIKAEFICTKWLAPIPL